MHQQLRQLLLDKGDQLEATRLANDAIELVNASLNAAGSNAVTSLLARALVARGVMMVAGAWFGDLTNAPEPETQATIRSLVLNPPPQWDLDCFIDPATARG